ncbi:hypothetical protein [Chromatocurvus halotolerans]|uniref:Tetratricopeptide repeat protein n=1 Tax=Chromatocurvus halotolerans TaxID=1132028 RepID=A0A4R2KUT1_9GAMM|nr:hypothetical protein [Chromatocurvus halotolerans]TCO77664.1 hypothetical protein EV688_102121 [Chromatocurvus halotolerans]
MLKTISSGFWLLTALLASIAALAREPASYGERIALRGAEWAEGRMDPALTVLSGIDDRDNVGEGGSQAQDSVTQWQAQVETLEAAGGPYASGLEEPLADLARQRVAEGRFGEALALYRRSLHILRVNTGLASPAQMTIVRAMLELQRALGDREGLDDLYGYYYRLGWLAADDEEGDERWRVALEYLRWQRELLRTADSGDPDRELLELFRLNTELLERASAEAAPLGTRQDLVQSQLKNLYLVQARVLPQVRESLSVLSPRRSRRQELLPEDVDRDRLLSLQRSAVATGAELLTSLAEQAESPVARAALYRELGDWEQWNGSWRRAEEAWRRAVSLLQDAGENDRLAEWFGEPVELPDNGAFWQPPNDADVSLVRAGFDVSERGQVRRATASVLAGRDSASILAVRELRDVRFRPRFDAGQAVAVEGLERDYEVYH